MQCKKYEQGIDVKEGKEILKALNTVPGHRKGNGDCSPEAFQFSLDSKKPANLLSLKLEGHEISEESHCLPFSSRDTSRSCGISDTSSKLMSHVA